MIRKIDFLFIAILALLPFVASDITLPILIEMQGIFGATETAVQQTLSAYLLGLSVGQIFLGSLSDTLGRKPVLLIGLLIFMLASFATNLAPSIEGVWVARFFQALGACAAACLWQSIVVDRFQESDRDFLFAWLFPITAISPVVTPWVGAYLAQVFGWTIAFWGMGLVAAGLIIYTSFGFEETLPLSQRHAMKWSVHFKNMWMLLKSPVFLGYTGMICFSSASFYAYIAEIPFIIESLGYLPADLGPLLIPQTAVFILGGLMSHKLASYFGSKQRALWRINLLAVMASVILYLSVTLFPVQHIWQIIIPYSVTAFSNGVIYPLAFSLIYQAHAQVAGTASGWVAFFLAITGFGGTFLMAIFSDYAAVGMAIIICIFYGLCFISGYLPEKEKI